MKAQKLASEFSEQAMEHFRVPEPNSEAVARLERLKQAVKHGGGNTAVASKSGVAFGTLNGHLAGREMKLSTASAIARACGVNLLWLADGDGPMEMDAPAPASAEKPQKTAFSAMDPDRLAAAMEAAAQAFRTQGREPTSRQLAQVTLILYDEPDASASRVK